MNKHYESVIDILGCYGFMIRVIETFETKDSLNALRFCSSLVLTSEPGGGGGRARLEFLGGDVPLGPWNPSPIPELVQLNFATLY